MNLFARLRSFFSSPSYPRTLVLVGIVLLALALPVTVTVLQQQTQTKQEASGTPLCQTLKGACIRPNLCSANCKICDSSKGCTNSTICCGSCNAQYIDHRFCCNDFGKYHYCQYYQYLDCSTQKRDLGYSSDCAPKPTATPTPTPVPNPKCIDATGAVGTCYINNSCGGGMHEVVPVNKTPYKTCDQYKTSSGQSYRICCAPGAPTPYPTLAPTCDSLKGICVGPGNNAQTDSNYYGKTTYAYTDCTGGVLKQATCSTPNTFCCPANNVIITVSTGVACVGPKPDQKPGTCWYNKILNNTGPAAFISGLDVETFSGTYTLYNTVKGGSGICGTTSELPYFMSNGTPTACLGSGSQGPNPSCSQGTAKGTCYTNNSCGNMKELSPDKSKGDTTCTSPYRICCEAASPTPTSKPTATPIPCKNGLTTQIAMSLKLPGIGNGNFENNAPKHGNRTAIYVSVADQNGKEVYPKNKSVAFKIESGRFNSSKLDLGNNKLTCGNTYTVQVKLATYLTATATVTYGASQSLNMDLIPGDINYIDPTTKQIIGDGKITVNDYSIIGQCHNADPTKVISWTEGSSTVGATCGDLMNFFDYPDGGTQGDEWANNYNLWLRGFIQANGYKI